MSKNANAVPIGKEEVREARRVLEKYRAAKNNLDERVTENEKWFRMRHWEQIRDGKSPQNRHTAWLFNSIINKHADFMDSIPECTVLPRESADETEAGKLTDVIPVVLERCKWERVYSDAAFAKLKTGTAVYSVLWDPEAAGGLGDIDVKQTDILNLFWEPGVKDIQKSRNLFCVELADNDVLIEEYPFLEGRLGAKDDFVKKYGYDGSVDTSGKSTVIDWYYKKRENGKTVLHYCKFVNDEILYSSENDGALRERGWYDHGLYPFVFDPLFKEEGTPTGFGFIDVMKETQEDIDTLGSEIMKNARMAAKKRYFTRIEGAVNEKEFADFSKDFIHVSGSSLGDDSIREISSQPLSPVYLSILNNKVQELKETSGNRDFTQGGITGGVTSGTAINALQEAGNKLSRDMIGLTYNAFAEVCTLIIELIRQFYSVPRTVRILGANGGYSYSYYDNSALTASPVGNEFGMSFGMREPVFDVSVKAHKQNPFSRSAQNQDALNFYQLGFFDPAKAVQSLACIELLDIDNKEKIKEIIRQNGNITAKEDGI